MILIDVTLVASDKEATEKYRDFIRKNKDILRRLIARKSDVHVAAVSLLTTVIPGRDAQLCSFPDSLLIEVKSDVEVNYPASEFCKDIVRECGAQYLRFKVWVPGNTTPKDCRHVN